MPNVAQRSRASSAIRRDSYCERNNVASERVSRADVLTDYFAHHALGVRGASADVTRRRDKTKIAAAVFNAAQAAIAAPIKIDFARAGRDPRVFKMGFERYQGGTI